MLHRGLLHLFTFYLNTWYLCKIDPGCFSVMLNAFDTCARLYLRDHVNKLLITSNCGVAYSMLEMKGNLLC